jgi:hypothetical protein
MSAGVVELKNIYDLLNFLFGKIHHPALPIHFVHRSDSSEK